MDKRTKVIATIGPQSSDEKTLEALFASGINVARLNCSHGSSEARRAMIQTVRNLADKKGKHLGILMDLQGPKIRIATFQNGHISLKKGARFTLKAHQAGCVGDATWVGLDPVILSDLKAGQTLLLDDGQIQLLVEQANDQEAVCTVIQGGILSDHKGINILGGGLSCPALTKKDIADIQDAIDFEVAYLAVSFVKDASDIADVRSHLPANTPIKIIAKIERKEAIENLEAIIEASDGIMVARGDLAIEVGDAEVPVLQKNMVQMARDHQKPAIVATHMMQSMIEHPSPTRAEVSDVANAILDGTDAVMLSAETATGKHPITVVQTVRDICQRVEKYAHKIYDIQTSPLHRKRTSTDEAIAAATMYTAQHYPLKAIITLTESGETALRLSRFSSHIPIFALSRTPATLRQMTLLRNVTPIYFDVTEHAVQAVNPSAMQTLIDQGYLNVGDLVALTKGSPIGIAGHTNSLQILEAKELL